MSSLEVPFIFLRLATKKRTQLVKMAVMAAKAANEAPTEMAAVLAALAEDSGHTSSRKPATQSVSASIAL